MEELDETRMKTVRRERQGRLRMTGERIKKGRKLSNTE